MNNDHDVLSRLVNYHDHIAAPPVHAADDLHRGRRRVRRNRRLFAGGVALAVVSVVAVASLLTGGRSADRHVFRLDCRPRRLAYRYRRRC